MMEREPTSLSLFGEDIFLLPNQSLLKGNGKSSG